MTLGDYLLSLSGQRRKAGLHDCCTFAADWAICQGRADPMAEWRGQYATDIEAEEIIGRAGGLAGLFAIGMSLAGIPQTYDDPAEGDVAVISIDGEEAGAIFTGKRWAFVPERGWGAVSLEPSAILARWRP